MHVVTKQLPGCDWKLTAMLEGYLEGEKLKSRVVVEEKISIPVSLQGTSTDKQSSVLSLLDS